MQYTLNTHIRFLLLITGGLTQCLALKHISVMRGDTLTLTCPIKSMKDAVEWRNPDGLIMFFNKDKGAPKLEKFEQEDKVIVKCSASANEHPPKLSWIMDNGLEIHPLPYYELKNASNKFTASSQLNVNIPKKRVTVKCVVRHPALYGSTVENFIHLGMQNEDTTTSSKHLTTTIGSTESTVIPTIFSSTSFTNSHSESKTTNDSKTTVNETTEDTSSNGRTSILSNNTTENEESDQSVESSKSKSSSEERQKQQQRGQGFWNTSFTKYKAEETPETETQTTSASVKVDNSQHFISGSGIKETEL
ncbi:cytotoxic and regulatory T-cell molecule [Silurus meridionalis]|nr:cytotoxic and regulatory T-cell molecule [Silurus meridionalis]